MNVQKRREAKQRLARKSTNQKNRKKQKEDTTKFLKSAGISFLIWGLVIVNLFLIASFVSKFWHAPEGNEMASITDNKQVPVVEQPALPKVQVEVLNGCGVQGVGKKITEFLRAKGYDVVKVDNYTSYTISETTVIDRRSMDKKNATDIARLLGVNLEKGVAPFLNEELMLDVTVIIGHDYSKLNPWK